MACPACGEEIPERSRFCPSCGFRVTGHGEERRIVTVLFADVVGFTTLSERRDPEQVKHLVDRCFQLLVADVVSFGGRVDKIIGDAILALFGAPIAHEDDAERAVRAALRMQQTVTERSAELDGAVRLRIGVNTGEVLVGALQAGGDYTAMGDVVNTANRLQTAARPGEVLVGEATFGATERVMPYTERGVVPAKGREAPVRAWIARQPLTAPGERANRKTGPLVGRDAEVSTLRSAASTALSNERASLLVLLGDAGMGKSRIAAEVTNDLTCTHDAVLLQGRCLPYGEVNAWWPLADALRGLIGVEPGEPLEVIEPRLRRLVAETARRETDDAEVTRTTSGLLQLFGFEEARTGIDPDRAREEVVRSFVMFLDDMTRQRPVILWLSDLHWADSVVNDLLSTTLASLARRPLVVQATARRSLLDSWSPPVGRFDTFALNLEALDADATDRLIDVLLGESETEELGDAARAELRERSGGNPLFLVELLALLDDQRHAQVGSMASDSLGELPDTLRGLVAARLDNLGAPERALIDDAAVLGRRGRVEHLAEMARQVRGVDDIAPELAEVEARDLIRIEGDVWEFCSDLTREVAYRMLTKSVRADKHLGVARWIEAQHVGPWSDRMVDQLAHHYGQAAELLADLGAVGQLSGGVRDRALHWIDEVSARGERLRLLPAVERLCTQGLALAGADPSPIRLTLLIRRARSRTLGRDAVGAGEDAAQAMALAQTFGDDVSQAAVLVIEGDLAQQAGDLAGSRRTLDRAVERYAAAGDEQGRAEALRARGMAELFAGRTAEAERTTTEARDAFQSLGLRSGEAWALQNLAWISLVQGRTTEAERRIGESLAIFGELGDSGGAAWARGLQGFVRLAEGDLVGADVLQRSVLADAQAGGDRWAAAMMQLLGSTVRLWTGRTESAVAAGRDGLAMFRAVHDHFGEARIAWPLARGLAMQGRISEALSVLDEVRRSLEGTDPESSPIEDRATVAMALASVEVHLGRPDRALEAVDWIAKMYGIDLVVAEPAGDLGEPPGAAPTTDDGAPLDGATADADVPDLQPPRRPLTASDLGGVGGGIETLATVGLARLQLGWVAGAADLMEAAARVAGSEAGCVPVACHLAFVRLAEGRIDEGEVLARRVLDDARTTYMDRALAHLVTGLAAARRREVPALRAAFERARSEVDVTGDVLTQAFVRLAEGRALDVVGDEGAVDRTADAWSRLHELGIDGAGWLNVFDLGLGLTLSAIAD
jgi:class 3 adenylate cyclase/tetratricopeptide (TPR) repeat protein